MFFSRPQHFGRRHTAIRSRQGAVELSQGLHSTGFPVGYKVWPLDHFFFSPFYEKRFLIYLKGRLKKICLKGLHSLESFIVKRLLLRKKTNARLLNWPHLMPPERAHYARSRFVTRSSRSWTPPLPVSRSTGEEVRSSLRPEEWHTRPSSWLPQG